MEILLDVWEGSLDIDEDLLLAEGVRGLIIRINDMNGGHHKDMTFDAQWAQGERFLRAPYFVYNPWVNGAQNYEWLARIAPAGLSIVFADIEVRKTGYSAETYADEVDAFMNLAKQKWPRVVIYTGAWFLPMLAHWPAGDYWWARYPWTLCPPGDREHWSWEKLRETACAYGYHPDPTNKCPGKPALWQCSGDKLIMPGCAERPMDINLWSGDLTSLEQWWGASMPQPPPVPPPMDWAHALTEWAITMGYIGPGPE